MFRENTRKPRGTRRADSAEASSYGAYVEDLGPEEDESEPAPLKRVLSRTTLILLEFMQFKSAQRIQAWWRGVHYRRKTDRRLKAAITMQRWWRGYSVRSKWYKFVEDELQRRIVEHYHKSATKIQALFRGWWIRQTVHDMRSLRHMQLCAAEDLLHCVAYKLHHLLRTYSIPGVYSLRNSHCLSRVEKLLASMNFRFHNDRTRFTQANRKAQADQQRKVFRESEFVTKVPYCGPNFNSLCKPGCDEQLHTAKDMDRRMYKIIAMYEASQRDKFSKKTHMSILERKRRQKLEEKMHRLESRKRNFCQDVLESLCKWKIWSGQQCKVPNDLYSNPAALEKFLDEFTDMVDDVGNATCHCQAEILDEPICH